MGEWFKDRAKIFTYTKKQINNKIFQDKCLEVCARRKTLRIVTVAVTLNAQQDPCKTAGSPTPYFPHAQF